MRRFVMPLTGLGMSLLAVGLVMAVIFETSGIDVARGHINPYGEMPPVYVAANVFWTLGAIVLIFPPLIGGFELLVVLELFLTVSGFMSFWQPESYALKIAARVILSLIAVGYLKHRGLLPGVSYPWALLSPRFYAQAFKAGDNRALAVGLEILGVGYALGLMSLITAGCAYLVRSSWVSWHETREPIFAAWTAVNVAYTGLGCIILTMGIFR